MKKIIVLAAATVIITTGAALSWPSELPEKDPVVLEVEQAKTKKAEPVATPVAPTVAPTVATEPIVEKPAPVEPPAPKIKTTREYGDDYLDLSSDLLVNCFDLIIAQYPVRFTEPVREKNVKALRAWDSVCSTGIMRGETGIMGQFGLDGAFFDSELAKSYN